MHWYPLLKTVHVSAVVISLSLFILRGGGMLADGRWRQWLVVRILPHVVDTILLASAIALAVLLRQYPFVHPWLTAKVLALVLYIVLGTIALKRGRTKTIRFFALLAAVLVFAYIVSVAVQHNPYGLLLAL
ncbi:MAG TPA: SirB2 family protein [Salinisphaeraceae bacterium]|nr:SirB2 family protein [Salinisphaeraceae bacterium]